MKKILVFTLALCFILSGFIPATASASTIQKKTVNTPIKKITKTKPGIVKKTPVKKSTVKKPIVVVPTKTVFTFAGWIPYWKKSSGTTDTYNNLKYLDIISPFSYEVTTDGKLIDKLRVQSEPWPGLFNEAKVKSVKVYPTVAWFNRAGIYATLSATSTRAAHIEEIRQTILENPAFDGVDIDYENKSAETKDYFSQFLKELAVETKKTNKKLICTIESRTPIAIRYENPTAQQIADSSIVSNDFTQIGKNCDQVRIMAYDQKRAIQVYNKTAIALGQPYAPVADTRWVEDVIKLFVKEIPSQKLILGVPTYGYKYEIVNNSDGTYQYEYLRSVNSDESFATARKYKAEIKRSVSGELYFTYTAEPQTSYLGRPDAPTHMIFFTDGESIHEKIQLAKKYKLGGIAMFKFDGVGDDSMWDIMRLVRSGDL